MEQGRQHHQNLIGPVVRRLRLEAGLSQDELAAKIQIEDWDLSRAGLSKIEARLRRVNDAELLILARVLKCGISELYPDDVSSVSEVVRQGAR